MLSHAQADIDVVLTHDPTQPLYSITLTKATPWPQANVFSLRFEGAAGLTISTNRHVIGNGGLSLTVTDSGFGNVLNGIAFNRQAVALIGDQAVAFSLQDAAEPTAAFRDCSVDPAV